MKKVLTAVEKLNTNHFGGQYITKYEISAERENDIYV
jgi:hypothetical protein